MYRIYWRPCVFRSCVSGALADHRSAHEVGEPGGGACPGHGAPTPTRTCSLCFPSSTTTL